MLKKLQSALDDTLNPTPEKIAPKSENLQNQKREKRWKALFKEVNI
jgi:hypothetical protein